MMEATSTTTPAVVTTTSSSTWTATSNERSETKANSPSKTVEKKRRTIPSVTDVLLYGTYVVGIVWHCVGNPLASICTGDFSDPRRWYIDESSLDPQHFARNMLLSAAASATTDAGGGGRNTRTATDRIKNRRRLSLLASAIRDRARIASNSSGSLALCDLLDRAGSPPPSSSEDETWNRRDDNFDCYAHRRLLHPDESSARQRPPPFSPPSFDVIRIAPISNAIAPLSTEAIAIVIPPVPPLPYPSGGGDDDDTHYTSFHASILRTMERLSSPQDSPWLSKTVLFVCPTLPPKATATTAASSDTGLLGDTVRSFLDWYLDDPSNDDEYDGDHGESPFSLPNHHHHYNIRGAVIRQLVVFDYDVRTATTTDNHEIRILPHGTRGVFPNMDLVFLCTTVFNTKVGTAGTGSTTPPTITVHPYHNSFIRDETSKTTGTTTTETYTAVDSVGTWLGEYLPQAVRTNPIVRKWSISFRNMLAFEYTAVFGGSSSSGRTVSSSDVAAGESARLPRRPPPHAYALDRGIDALTVQGVFRAPPNRSNSNNMNNHHNNRNTNWDTAIAEYVAKLEPIVRGLSNLYERLHHSTSLYLLISHERFVKHEEYLIPNLLVLIPCIVRAVSFLLRLFPPSSRKGGSGSNSNSNNAKDSTEHKQVDNNHAVGDTNTATPTATINRQDGGCGEREQDENDSSATDNLVTKDDDDDNNNNNNHKCLTYFDVNIVREAMCLTILGIAILCSGLALIDEPRHRYSPSPSKTPSSSAQWHFYHHLVVLIAYVPIVSSALSFTKVNRCTRGENGKRTGATIRDTARSSPSDLAMASTPETGEGPSLQSIQFAACLLAVYVHVPILFGHVSLAFPSALFWTPLIAFPSYNNNDNSNNKSSDSDSTKSTTTARRVLSSLRTFLAVVCSFLLVVCTCPVILLVPRLFPTYTPYVKYGYIPLHLISSFLWLKRCRSVIATNKI